MSSRLITSVAGTLVVLSVSVVSAGETPRAAGSAPVHEVNVDANGLIRVHEQGTVMSQVTNFPLDPSGNLRVSGSVGVSGTVEATQSGPWSVAQSGPWTVGLDPAASSSLSNIDTATSGLQYDTDGNLKVSVAPTGAAADPSVADQSPFGFTAAGGFPAGESFTVSANPSPARVTSYYVEAREGSMTVFFKMAGSIRFAFRLAAGQSATGSLAHAILTDALTVACGDGSNCLIFYSIAGY